MNKVAERAELIIFAMLTESGYSFKEHQQGNSDDYSQYMW